MMKTKIILAIILAMTLFSANSIHSQVLPMFDNPSDGNDSWQCPSSQVGLAPPSGHWVFNQPISVQTKLVTIEVNVVGARNKHIINAEVLAYCEPWDFAKKGSTDASGRWRFVGPIGDYSFYASSGEILSYSKQTAISTNTNVTLSGTIPVRIAFVRPDGSPFEPACQGSRWCLFTPTNLPSPVGFIGAGGINEGKTSWLTTPDVIGVLALMRCPDEQASGYIVFQDFPTDSLSTIVVDDEKLGCVRFQLDGLPACDTWWNFWFDSVNNEVGTHWIWASRVSSTGGTYEVRLTPGLYRVWTDVCSATDWSYGGAWVPVVLDIEPNSVHVLHFGGTFDTRIDIITWHPGYVHLWFDIMDNGSKYLYDVGGVGHLILKRDSQVLFDGSVQVSSGRYIGFGNPLADDMKQGLPVEFEYQFSSSVLGSITTSGILPRDREMRRDAPIAGQSPHFELHSRDPAPYADEILRLLECAYDWLVNEYSGPFSPQSRGRFALHYEAPAGVAWSSGDLFCTDVYSSYSLTGDSDQTAHLYHEFAHTCMSSFPQHRTKGFTSNTGESQANLISPYLAKAVHGERTFRGYRHRQWRSTQFFGYISGLNDLSETDRYVFPLLYIDARYGQAVNRDFFSALWTNKNNLGSILETADFLKTESERTATLYSYLVNENLAWLYRWAGFTVSDEIVNQGIAYIQSFMPADGYIATLNPGTSNLVAYYKLDGDAQDSSGNGNNGTLVGNPTWRIRTGKVGSALRFDGVDDYVDCGNDTSLNITDAVTISAWIKPAVQSADHKISGNEDGRGGGYKLGVFINNKVEFGIRTSSNWTILNRNVTGGTVLMPNVWYHVAGVYIKGNYISTYVNGVLDRVLTTSHILGSSTGTFKIGREPCFPQCFWNGMIDELRVYNKALSPAEIAYLADDTPDDGRLYVPAGQ